MGESAVATSVRPARSGLVLAVGLLMVLWLGAGVAHASHPFDRQEYELRTVLQAVWLYHADHGHYPVTDAEGTWYEKLVAANPNYTFSLPLTPDGTLPVDYYGHPLVYEPPSAANGRSEAVVRSVGANGLDEQGAGDDWDFRYGPNMGYWYKQNWPAAQRRAVICAVLAVIGSGLILWGVQRRSSRAMLLCCYLGLLMAVVLQAGFDTGPIGRSSASIDPIWLLRVGQVGVTLLYIGGGLSGWTIVAAVFRSRRCPEGCCLKCRYDLRGLNEAGVMRCPECGEPFAPEAGGVPKPPGQV